MGKIDDYIAANFLKPSSTLYHTNRSVDGTGKIRVLVPKSDGIARVEYKCPKCAHESYVEQEWKRPFAIKCEGCGAKIAVPKLKQQFKRDMKKAKA
ncbi:MAG TPA: hypothetical protein VI979_00840 [archaeon]|nr:hypothetical protein [archaeon]